MASMRLRATMSTPRTSFALGLHVRYLPIALRNVSPSTAILLLKTPPSFSSLTATCSKTGLPRTSYPRGSNSGFSRLTRGNLVASPDPPARIAKALIPDLLPLPNGRQFAIIQLSGLTAVLLQLDTSLAQRLLFAKHLQWMGSNRNHMMRLER